MLISTQYFVLFIKNKHLSSGLKPRVIHLSYDNCTYTKLNVNTKYL